METVQVEDRGTWHRLVLNRPSRLNAFNGEMHLALADALRRARAAPSCRAVLLTGAGRAFCAGQDLSERADAHSGAPDLGASIERHYNPLVRLLRDLSKPVVCAVNGVAAGAGANLALACDVVLAARSATFVQAFIKLGLVPDSGGTYFLPRLVGEARARAMAMTGEAISAERAEAWGMIWRAVDDEALAPEAEALTERLTRAPSRGLALTKRALAASAANTLDGQLDLERDLQREAGRDADYAEGVRAFAEKRAPDFGGPAYTPAGRPEPDP